MRLTVPAGYGYSHTRMMMPILLGNHKTSCALNLSLGGLRYRMRRITEIIRHDLANAAIRFEIHLALKILHLLQPESLFSSVREGD